MNLPAIALENLTVTYNRHPAVHHVSGSLARGSLTAIAGRTARENRRCFGRSWAS